VLSGGGKSPQYSMARRRPLPLLQKSTIKATKHYIMMVYVDVGPENHQNLQLVSRCSTMATFIHQLSSPFGK
jgi:hypothetical protein